MGDPDAGRRRTVTLAAVTLDVDSLRFYRAIHGLPAGEGSDPDPIYTVAMPRFWELVDGLPCTLFLIGADAPRYPEAFEPVWATGSEVASHSFHHDYRLVRRATEDVVADLVAAERALTPLNGGRRPVGFRAPGYNQSPVVLQALIDRGYHYDSSLLPSPAYFGLRAGAIGWYGMKGRPSASFSGEPRAFQGPIRPYRMQPEGYWTEHPAGPLWEFPIAVESRTRWPLIGTTWAVMPRILRRRAFDGLKKRQVPFVFEMHALDLLDHQDVGPELVRHQADLQVPVREKWRRFEELLRWMRSELDLRPLRRWRSALEEAENRPDPRPDR
jgi:hypothetical protein